MPSKQKHANAPVEKVLQLREALLTLIHSAKLSLREIDRRTGLRRGCTSALFAGKIELSAYHIFAILSALEISPVDFFEALYPRRRPEPLRLKTSVARAAAEGFTDLEPEDLGDLSPAPKLPAQINVESLGQLIESKLAEAVNSALLQIARKQAAIAEARAQALEEQAALALREDEAKKEAAPSTTEAVETTETTGTAESMTAAEVQEG